MSNPSPGRARYRRHALLEQIKKLPERCVAPSICEDFTAVDRREDARIRISLHSHGGIV